MLVATQSTQALAELKAQNFLSDVVTKNLLCFNNDINIFRLITTSNLTWLKR